MVNRKTLRPNSQYAMHEYRQKQGVTEKENFGFASEKTDVNGQQSKMIPNGYDSNSSSWYKDVIELRKKAGEYKVKMHVLSIFSIFFNYLLKLIL